MPEAILAEANRFRLSIAKEADFGVIPASGLEALRITGESLKQDTDSTASNELRFDRQRADLIRTGLRANGGFDFEFSYGSFDTLLEALLFSNDWTAVVTVANAATDVSVDAMTKTYTSVAGWGSTPLPGTLVRFEGHDEEINRGIKRVVSADANNIEVAETVADEAAGATVTIRQGGLIVNGTQKRSFFIQGEYSDLAAMTTGKYRHYTGMVPATGSLAVTTQGIITGSFGFLGKRELSAAVAAGGAIAASNDNQPMNAIDNVTAFLENGATVDITDFTLEVDNNLAERLRIGTLGAFSIRAGTIDVKGSFEGYYEDSRLVDKYLNWENTSLRIDFEDAAGNYYAVEIPRCKFSDATRNATGINEDIKSPITFEAFRDNSTPPNTIRWYRWPALAA